MILAGGDVPTLAAKAATTRIPIVFTQSPDPVGNGLVRSLAMPGGNVTGLSYVAPDLAGKRMQLLHEALPSARRVAMIWAASERSVAGEVKASSDAAARLGLRIEPWRLEAPDKVMRQFDRIGKTRPDVLLVLADPRMISYRDIVIEWANRNRPADGRRLAGFREGRGPAQLFAELRGALPPLGALRRQDPQGREAGRSSRRAADGVRPGDQPRDARMLGLTIPQSLLLRADEVIQ